MTFYCPIGQELLNFVTNCCKLLKVNHCLPGAQTGSFFYWWGGGGRFSRPENIFLPFDFYGGGGALFGGGGGVGASERRLWELVRATSLIHQSMF